MNGLNRFALKLMKLRNNMNKKINSLKKKLDTANADTNAIEMQLQEEYNKIFAKDKTIAKDIKELDNSNEYGADQDGIYSWVRFYAPESFPAENLKAYFSDNGYNYDSENDTLMQWHGDDNIIIQDDTRHDNGVWQGHNLIIEEREYRETNPENEHYGDVNEDIRNELIEKHMEKTGYFPGVFRIDYHGNVFPVSTLKKKVS